MRFDRKVRPSPYAVPTDDEVARLLAADDRDVGLVLLFCLLTGMRSGEAVGLLRDDLVRKGSFTSSWRMSIISTSRARSRSSCSGGGFLGFISWLKIAGFLLQLYQMLR